MESINRLELLCVRRLTSGQAGEKEMSILEGKTDRYQ